MSYLKDREIWLSNVPTGNPPAGYFWKFIQNGKVVVRDSSGNNQIMVATSGSQAITGSLIVTGGITGTVSSASYVEYSNVANKPTLVSGSSQVTFLGLSSIPSGIVSGSSQVAQFGYATTGSNGFNGSQSITGSLTVTGQVIAQTLNVQQVTSSVVFSSGSNVFGNNTGNTHRFTGSLGVTGSLSVAGAGTFSSVKPQLYVIGDGANGAGIYLNTLLSGANRRNWAVFTEENTDGDFAIKCSTAAGGNPNTGNTRLAILNNGNVGIGTSPSNPGKKLEISDDNNSTSTTTGLKIINSSLTANARAGIVFQSYDNNGAAIWSNRTGTTTGELIFGTNNSESTAETNISERMRIYSDGVVTTRIIQLNDPTYFASNFYGIRLAGVDNGSNGTNFQVQGRTSPTGVFSTLLTVTNSGVTTFNNSVTATGATFTGQLNGTRATFSESFCEVRSLSTTTSDYANFIVDTNNNVNYRLQMVGFGTTASGTLAGISRAGNGFVVKSGGLLAIGTRDLNDLVLSTNETERMRITSGGTVNISNLAGTGSRRVFSDSSGNLSAPQTDTTYNISLSGLSAGSWFTITAHNFNGFAGLVVVTIPNLNSEYGYISQSNAWIFQQGANLDPSYDGLRGVTIRPDGTSYEGYNVVESYHTAPNSGRVNMRMRLRQRNIGLGASNPLNLQIWVDHVVGITAGTPTLTVRSF